jgi:hypothetical protein
MNIDVACGPRPLPGEPDRLYHNTGKGTFVDVTKRAGVTDPGYYGFGVLFSDLDDDGWPDIYVANDSTPNLFFRNQRNGTFLEQALQSGLAVTADGREQAGMGVDAGDYDGDGRLDVVNETSRRTSRRSITTTVMAFRRRFSSGSFHARPVSGWGVGPWTSTTTATLDLFIANGHIHPMSGAPGRARSGSAPGVSERGRWPFRLHRRGRRVAVVGNRAAARRRHSTMAATSTCWCQCSTRADVLRNDTKGDTGSRCGSKARSNR